MGEYLYVVYTAELINEYISQELTIYTPTAYQTKSQVKMIGVYDSEKEANRKCDVINNILNVKTKKNEQFKCGIFKAILNKDDLF